MLREVRLKKNGEAPVPLRHGQVFKRSVISICGQRFRLRGLFFIVLLRLQVAIVLTEVISGS